MDSKTKKSQLIATGKDVADFIVGSHRILDVFKAFYTEWDEHREKSIALLEKLADVVTKSSKDSDKIKDVIYRLNRFANTVPNQAVSLGTRIATAIGEFFAGIFTKEMDEKEFKAKEFEIRQIFQKDIDSTSLIYIHGAQCNSQFEETRQYIKKFHHLIREEEEDLESIIEDEDVVEFLKDIVFYNPDNVSVFYRRLKFDYEVLLRNSKSTDSRNFIRVFEDVPAAVQIIDLLAWNFDTDGYDVTIVDKEWNDLFVLFLHPEDFNVRLFLERIQNCIFILKKERDILKRTTRNLLSKIIKEQS